MTDDAASDGGEDTPEGPDDRTDEEERPATGDPDAPAEAIISDDPEPPEPSEPG